MLFYIIAKNGFESSGSPETVRESTATAKEFCDGKKFFTFCVHFRFWGHTASNCIG